MKLFKNFKTKKQLRKEIEDLRNRLAEEEKINSYLLNKTREVISEKKQFDRVIFTSRFETYEDNSIIREFPEERLLDELMKQLKKYLKENDFINQSLIYEKQGNTLLAEMLLDIYIGKAS